MKSLPIIGVYNMWLYLYSGVYNNSVVGYTKDNRLDANSIIDKTILNESIYSEILLESFPQMLIQIINNILMGGSWSAVSYISVLLSGLVASSPYHYYYYYHHHYHL